MNARPRLVTPAPETAGPDDGPVVVQQEPIDPAGPGADILVDRLPTPAGAPARVEVVVDGWRFVYDVEDAERAHLRARAARDRADAGGGGAPVEIRAIIPGRVVAVSVSADEAVDAGQPLLVVEAMKMQNELRAPRAGTVQRVVATVGATIEIGELLVVLA